MYAAQLASTRPAVASRPSRHDDHGEAVVVTPGRPGACDDGAFAGHAAFGWRSSTHMLAGSSGSALRYSSHRPTATFPVDGMARAQIGDRITRCWDGAMFEIVAAFRDGDRLRCDLVELDGRLH